MCELCLPLKEGKENVPGIVDIWKMMEPYRNANIFGEQRSKGRLHSIPGGTPNSLELRL
jgi:hypothetical protein